MDKNIIQEVDKLIITGIGQVTEGKGRLDLPRRLPICSGYEEYYCGNDRCLFGIFWRYRKASGIFGDGDLAISMCRNKTIMFYPDDFGFSSGLFYYKIDDWGEETYEKALPWILSLYSPEFTKKWMNYFGWGNR